MPIGIDVGSGLIAVAKGGACECHYPSQHYHEQIGTLIVHRLSLPRVDGSRGYMRDGSKYGFCPYFNLLKF